MDFVAIDLETANEKRSSAAANILINIAKELNLDKIEDISKIIGFKWAINNILINNVKNSENLNTNQMSNKLKTALNYINQGQDLIIIDEEKLEEILKGKNTILNKYWLYTYNRLYNIS